VLIGYARGEADGPAALQQVEQLRAVGCHIIFGDGADEGALGAYPELAKALEALAVGDVLVVTRLHQTSHSLSRLFGLILDVHQRGADLWAIEDDLDTRTKDGQFVFKLIGILNQFEGWHLSRRLNLRAETARRRGSKPGRKRRVTPDIVSKARELITSGKSIREAAAALDVSKSRLHEALRDPDKGHAVDQADTPGRPGS
jgi:DNA invertase Pin-like site-specific DNA recombinase